MQRLVFLHSKIGRSSKVIYEKIIACERGTMTTMKKRVSIEKISLKDAPSTKEIIEELAMSRMRSHMTQIEAAQASGLLQPVISKLEQGRHDPRLTTILKILDVYGKTLAIVPKAGAK